MTTDTGGWTMLLANQMAPLPPAASYPANNDLYKGTSTINNNFNMFGVSLNSQNLQKAVKFVSGTYLRIYDTVNKSTVSSPLGTKVTNYTPWITEWPSSEASGLSACIGSLGKSPAWSYSYSGSNTYMSFLAGCSYSESYGDRQGVGIAAYVQQTASSCGVSGNALCSISYIVGQPFHRGMSVTMNGTKSTVVWIK